jgi:hypothetical protein
VLDDESAVGLFVTLVECVQAAEIEVVGRFSELEVSSREMNYRFVHYCQK